MKLVSKTDIAKRWGCFIQSVNSYQKRDNNFPKPIDKVSGGKVEIFSLDDIIKYEMNKGIKQDKRFHNIWKGMFKRCYEKSHNRYKNYGGRGISVCERWKDFYNFREDMYDSYLEHIKKYGENDTSLDRLDTDGNYQPDNCKWSTTEEQNHNFRIHKRKFKATNLKTGETYIRNVRAEFAREVGISDKHIGSVLNGNRNETEGFTFEYID